MTGILAKYGIGGTSYIKVTSILAKYGIVGACYVIVTGLVTHKIVVLTGGIAIADTGAYKCIARTACICLPGIISSHKYVRITGTVFTGILSDKKVAGAASANRARRITDYRIITSGSIVSRLPPYKNAGIAGNVGITGLISYKCIITPRIRTPGLVTY